MHFALNADIDELLVVNGTTLGELICKKDCVVFDSYWVPFRYSAPDSDYNFRDFLFRKREPRGFAGAKYAFRFAAVRLNGVHSVELGRASRFPALRLDVGHAYLLHYKGITTNWKRVYYDRLRPEVPNPDDVRLDFGSLWGDLDAGANISVEARYERPSRRSSSIALFQSERGNECGLLVFRFMVGIRFTSKVQLSMPNWRPRYIRIGPSASIAVQK